MPSPSTSLAIPRPDLGECMEEFDLAADREGFVGYRVSPVINVGLKASTFGRITLESLLQDTETKRAPRTGYNRGDWNSRRTAIRRKTHGAEQPVDDEEAKVYEDYFDAEAQATKLAYDRVLRRAEKRVAAMIFDPTTWTGSSLTTTITNEWDKNHLTDADPIGDVDSAKDKVWDGTGLWPNALVICRKVFNNLRKLDQIKDAIASTGAGYPTRARDITAEQLAAVFDLDYVLIAGSAKNTAGEGVSRSIASIWSDEYAMVCRVAVTQQLLEPCIARVFHWTGRGSQLRRPPSSSTATSRSSRTSTAFATTSAKRSCTKEVRPPC